MADILDSRKLVVLIPPTFLRHDYVDNDAVRLKAILQDPLGLAT